MLPYHHKLFIYRLEQNFELDKRDIYVCKNVMDIHYKSEHVNFKEIKIYKSSE